MQVFNIWHYFMKYVKVLCLMFAYDVIIIKL